MSILSKHALCWFAVGLTVFSSSLPAQSSDRWKTYVEYGVRAQGVGTAQHKSAITSLAEQLQSPDVEQRRAAMNELATDAPHLRLNDIVPLLKETLHDPDARVRGSAAGTLLMLTLTGVAGEVYERTPSLREALTFRAANDESTSVRKAAIGALVSGFPPRARCRGTPSATPKRRK